jgi:flagellar assembly factor FliW
MEIEFPHGLPGFEKEHRFYITERAGFEPLVFLQSAISPGLCFTALPVQVIDPGYQLELTPEEVRLLSGGSPISTGLLSLAIVTAQEDGPVTVNLLAPVVVNLAQRVGLQAVRSDTRYSHCHPLGEATPCS